MTTANDRGAPIWYELMTGDPGGAKAFYDAVIGWTMQDSGTAMPNGAEYRMIGRSDGGNAGGVLSISPDMAAHGVKPGWFVYLNTPDVDATCQALTEAGGAVHLPPSDMGAGRLAMVSDPWGAIFYVLNPTPPKDQPEARSDVFADKPQHIRWHDVWTADPDAAAAFYETLFGWRTQGEMPMGDGRTYRFLVHGESAIGGLGQALADGPGPRLAIYIGVDDIDRAVAAVRSGGGTLFGEPTAVPGGDFSVHARDPQGASFSLVGPRKGGFHD